LARLFDLHQLRYSIPHGKSAEPAAHPPETLASRIPLLGSLPWEEIIHAVSLLV
jgi:hypothetical protein